jgi:hypothetical protein
MMTLSDDDEAKLTTTCHAGLRVLERHYGVPREHSLGVAHVAIFFAAIVHFRDHPDVVAWRAAAYESRPGPPPQLPPESELGRLLPFVTLDVQALIGEVMWMEARRMNLTDDETIGALWRLFTRAAAEREVDGLS